MNETLCLPFEFSCRNPVLHGFSIALAICVIIMLLLLVIFWDELT